MYNAYYGFLPRDIEGIEQLAELALDLRNCWDHGADYIWDYLDHDLWRLTHNPWVVLQTVSRKRLEQAARDRDFRSHLEQALANQRQRDESVNWFERAHPGADLGSVAYFSMEFGLSEALPIYSGGLGNVAGDQLKAASDLGVPVAGVGLLYQQGYFRQFIDHADNQTALYPYNDPGQLPISPVRDREGEWFRLPLQLPGQKLWLRVWQARVGRVPLYLLDSNDPANPPIFRGITSELYGGGPEMRLQQELTLGIGGWRLLRALGVRVSVCHLNEGHAAMAVLERAADFMETTGKSFAVALTATRAGNLFTTHTPVPAGFDRFAPELIAQYLRLYAERRLHIGIDELLALGRINPSDSSEPFNMAWLAVRGSGAINAVSRLHAQVSRAIFQPLFPRWPGDEVPVGHVTNGIHTPSWDSAAADELWTGACGRHRWRGAMEETSAQLRCMPDEAIWNMRAKNRIDLVHFVRARMALELATRGETEPIHAGVFDPNALTLGFARRFASYKRPNLLLHDQDRLARLLTRADRPVQIVVAGKAHPADLAGQAMIREWLGFMRRTDVRSHAVFLSDYDLALAETLVRGVDVWINTPRRPWEACGTSGMKVLVNGGLNLSELDGWWAEAYAPEVGWALGDGREHDADPAWDAAEATQLYDLLEREIAPRFYERDSAGLPRRWIAMIRESMARLTPQFSANRSVREYLEKYYLPMAAKYRDREADGGGRAERLLAWRDELDRHWNELHFGNVEVETRDGRYLFRIHAYLDELPPDAVAVELFADAAAGRPAVRVAMTRGEELVGAARGWNYRAEVAADRPAEHFTARIVPSAPDASVPLEAAHIVWQR